MSTDETDDFAQNPRSMKPEDGLAGKTPSFPSRWLKWKSQKRNKSPVDPLESLSDLIDATLDDPIMRGQILNLVKFDSFNRRSILNTWLAELQLKDAPGELINALACLKDDEVAARAKRLLEGSKDKDEKD